MNREEAAAEIQKSKDAAYWAVCDAEGRAAIDPADLDAPETLLDEAYDAALLVEQIAADRGISWHNAREVV